MAGLWLTVCLPPGAGSDVVAALDAALAPFEAMRGYAAERDQWDEWIIAGGFDGYGFRIRPGAEDDPRLIHDQPHWSDGPRPSLPGMCAGGPTELLDLTGPAAEAEAAAGELWDRYHELRGTLPPALPFTHFLARSENPSAEIPIGPDRGSDRAHRRYRDQPLIRELMAAPSFGAGALHHIRDVLPWFAMPRDQYVATRVEETRRRSELLTLDGWWVELNDAPVHGACESLDTCPHRDGMTRPWSRADMAAYLEQLPGAAIVVSVHCHV